MALRTVFPCLVATEYITPVMTRAIPQPNRFFTSQHRSFVHVTGTHHNQHSNGIGCSQLHHMMHVAEVALLLPHIIRPVYSPTWVEDQSSRYAWHSSPVAGDCPRIQIQDCVSDQFQSRRLSLLATRPASMAYYTCTGQRPMAL